MDYSIYRVDSKEFINNYGEQLKNSSISNIDKILCLRTLNLKKSEIGSILKLSKSQISRYWKKTQYWILHLFDKFINNIEKVDNSIDKDFIKKIIFGTTSYVCKNICIHCDSCNKNSDKIIRIDDILENVNNDYKNINYDDYNFSCALILFFLTDFQFNNKKILYYTTTNFYNLRPLTNNKINLMKELYSIELESHFEIGYALVTIHDINSKKKINKRLKTFNNTPKVLELRKKIKDLKMTVEEFKKKIGNLNNFSQGIEDQIIDEVNIINYFQKNKNLDHMFVIIWSIDQKYRIYQSDRDSLKTGYNLSINNDSELDTYLNNFQTIMTGKNWRTIKDSYKYCFKKKNNLPNNYKVDLGFEIKKGKYTFNNYNNPILNIMGIKSLCNKKEH